MNDLDSIAMLQMSPEDDSTLHQWMDVVFSLPFLIIVSLLLIPAAVLFLNRRHMARAIILSCVCIFLVSELLLHLLPRSSDGLFAGDAYWLEFPEHASFVGLIVTVTAPVAFLLITLYIVRRLKTWMQDR